MGVRIKNSDSTKKQRSGASGGLLSSEAAEWWSCLSVACLSVACLSVAQTGVACLSVACLSVGRGQRASAGPQNKATTFSSTPSLFLTLPLKIIAARNHTSATFNSMHVSEPWLNLWYQIRTNDIYLINKIYDIFWCPPELQNGKHGQNKTLAQNSTTTIIPTARHKPMWNTCTKQQKHSLH